MRLLLFSNSTNAGHGYLDFPLPYIRDFLTSDEKNVLFVPYAGISVGFDAYAELVQGKLSHLGLKLESIHRVHDKKEAINRASVIIIGGGNTFFLLKMLQAEKLIQPIRENVLDGKSYIGWSAGSNITCPTLCTTNDMPIVEPESFKALNLVPFQINPHYTDFVQKGHAGETREMRIQEYIIANQEMYVVGLREGTLLQINNKKMYLKGDKPCRIFRYNREPEEISPGEELSFLL